MIFVTVGTHNQGFERLIKTVDKLVGQRKINEEVIIQTGYTDYTPQNCKWFKFTSFQNFVGICKKSSVVITHGGVGSIMIPLKFKKPTIVVPRLKKFNEHIDNHQLQIVKELEKLKKIIAVYDTNDLYSSINEAKQLNLKNKKQTIPKIFKIVEEQLNEWKKH